MYRRKRKRGKRKPRKLPTFLAADEPERLLRATETLRDRVLLMTMLYLGLRVSEASKLCVEHIDFPHGMLVVREGKGMRDRALPIPKKLVGPLRGFIGTRTLGPVFVSRKGNRLSPRRIQEMFKQFAVKAELRDATAARRVTPHKMRHSFASRMLERGASIVEVRDALGHSSLATTNTYCHAQPEALRKSMEI